MVDYDYLFLLFFYIFFLYFLCFSLFLLVFSFSGLVSSSAPFGPSCFCNFIPMGALRRLEMSRKVMQVCRGKSPLRVGEGKGKGNWGIAEGLKRCCSEKQGEKES